jgi:hypothetical protein
MKFKILNSKVFLSPKLFEQVSNNRDRNLALPEQEKSYEL